MDEPEARKTRNKEAWERYMRAERRELEVRQDGHLAKVLGRPLPNESPEKLERLAGEDPRRALEGLVELMSASGEIFYKHIDDFTPQDIYARGRAEGSESSGWWAVGPEDSLLRLEHRSGPGSNARSRFFHA